MELHNTSSSHAVYNIKLHIVFVTKYRRKALSPDLLDYLKAFYWKPLFWHRAYFVCSVSGATLETAKPYVERQGTLEHAKRKRKAP